MLDIMNPRITDYATLEELDMLTDPEKINMPWRLIYRVLFYSALRSSELLLALVNQIVKNQDGYFLRLLDQKNETKNELTPLRKDDYIALKEYIELNQRGQGEYIFVGQRKAPFSNQWLNIQLRKHCKIVGIDRYLTSHSFRRGRVVQLKNEGLPYAEIASITRHQNVAVLMKHYDKDVKRHAYEIVNKPPKK